MSGHKAQVNERGKSNKIFHGCPGKHKLKQKNYKKPYSCNGCKEQGFGLGYRCEPCEYDLHNDCVSITKTRSHDFFGGSTFKFFNQPPRKKNCDERKKHCDACGQTVNGFVYHCEEKGLYLHPCCMNLEKKLYVNADGVKLKLQLHKKVESTCLWCEKKTLGGNRSKTGGWSYVSKCKNYHFHVYCIITEVGVEGWKGGRIENNCLALEKLGPRLKHKSTTHDGGKVSKFWMIAAKIVTTVVGLLMGDPTMLLFFLTPNLRNLRISN